MKEFLSGVEELLTLPVFSVGAGPDFAAVCRDVKDIGRPAERGLFGSLLCFSVSVVSITVELR